MRIFIFLTLFFILSNCSTVEVAREVTKATKSIKESIQNFNQEKMEIKKEKEDLKIERDKERVLANEQKKIIEIKFIGLNLAEIEIKLGKPSLLRIDGNTKIARFDKNSCRIFFFFNQKYKNPKVEYFEIRDRNGQLINNKKKIKNCYKNLY
jgi:hypothetical protein